LPAPESVPGPSAQALIAEAQHRFGDVSRPAHFTDYEHCCECAEHDATFQAHTPETIGREALGHPGWDPLCFATDAAFLYYFPALVRHAITGIDDNYYLDQWLFNLVWDGPRNRRLAACSAEQRRFVTKVIEWLLENRDAEIEANSDTDNLLSAYQIWSDAIG